MATTRAPRRFSVSVDLDALPHYCRIFGLPEALLDERARALVATHAVPRYLALFARLGVPATFFVVGADLADARLAGALRRAAATGVELASHSFAHDYRLSTWAAPDIAADLARADEAIAALGVGRPQGFRAPGYAQSPALLSAVANLGYRYDSSAYPAAPYWALKAGVMGALRLLGRPSRALLDTPRVLLAPRVPYRPSLHQPYARGAAPLVELPMAVDPVLRVPLIGGTVSLLPWPVVSALATRLRDDAYVNLELHAVDVLDEHDGLPPELVARQRDLRVPVAEKLARFTRLLGMLGQGREAVTMATAAAGLAPAL